MAKMLWMYKYIESIIDQYMSYFTSMSYYDFSHSNIQYPTFAFTLIVLNICIFLYSALTFNSLNKNILGFVVSAGGFFYAFSILNINPNHTESIVTNFLQEFYVLGLLVFVLETLHNRHTAKQIELSQIASIKTLLFFMQESNEDKDKDKDTSPFGKAVVSQIKYLKCQLTNDPIFEDKLRPYYGELFFHNLDNVLEGLKDLIIDSQIRDSDASTFFSKIYKSIRMLEFLNQRFLFTYTEKIAELTKHKVETIELIHGIVLELEKIYKTTKDDKYFKKVILENLDEKNQPKFNIHDAIYCRIYCTIYYICKVEILKRPVLDTEDNNEHMLRMLSNYCNEAVSSIKKSESNTSNQNQNNTEVEMKSTKAAS